MIPKDSSTASLLTKKVQKQFHRREPVRAPTPTYVQLGSSSLTTRPTVRTVQEYTASSFPPSAGNPGEVGRTLSCPPSIAVLSVDDRQLQI